VLWGGHAIVRGLTASLSPWRCCFFFFPWVFVLILWRAKWHSDRFLWEIFGFCLSFIIPTVLWQWVVDPLLSKEPKKHSVLHPILKMKEDEGRTTAGHQMTTVSEMFNVDVHKFYLVRYICNLRSLLWQPSSAACLISLSKVTSTKSFCRFEQQLGNF